MSDNMTLTDNQNVPMQDTECNISHCIEDQTIEMSTKEINATVVEDMKIVCETMNESVEKKVEDSTTSEANQNVSFPNIPEIQQETIMGTGGTCLISKLKEELQKVTNERDSYHKKLESTEKKLAELQKIYDALLKDEGNEVVLRRMVDQLKDKLIQTSLQLEDRIRIVSNQEKQISALNNQVKSLKEVESLTENLLQIRNMEIEYLKVEVDELEVRVYEERERYNTLIDKMDATVKLNADLKKEYETQLSLFKDLQKKYQEKVSLLSKEKVSSLSEEKVSLLSKEKVSSLSEENVSLLSKEKVSLLSEEKRALEANVQSPK